VRSMGIDPAKRPARDTLRLEHSAILSERARVSRWARGPVRSMGIDPAKRPARDTLHLERSAMFSERASA